MHKYSLSTGRINISNEHYHSITILCWTALTGTYKVHVEENAALPQAHLVPPAYVQCFIFPILKPAWNPPHTSGDSTPLQSMLHPAQRNSTHTWSQKRNNNRTHRDCLHTRPELTQSPASTEKTQIWHRRSQEHHVHLVLVLVNNPLLYNQKLRACKYITTI